MNVNGSPRYELPRVSQAWLLLHGRHLYLMRLSQTPFSGRGTPICTSRCSCISSSEDLGLPGESAAALVAQFLHFSAGYAIVASLLDGGVLTLETALVTLVIESMVIVTQIYIKYSVPLYPSLFGRFGGRVSLMSLLF